MHPRTNSIFDKGQVELCHLVHGVWSGVTPGTHNTVLGIQMEANGPDVRKGVASRNSARRVPPVLR